MHLKVFVSGLTASGTTTLAMALSKRYAAEYNSASTTLIQLAKNEALLSLVPEEFRHFWLSQSGVDFFRVRLADSSLDRSTDIIMLSHLYTPVDSILDSLTGSLLMAEGSRVFSILLQASLTSRAKRVFGSTNDLSLGQVVYRVRRKDHKTHKLLQSLWGINILKPDIDRYDLVINDSDLLKILGPSASSYQKTIKYDISSAFVDLYQHVLQSDDKVQREQLIDRCGNILLKYRKAIKKYPIFDRKTF